MVLLVSSLELAAAGSAAPAIEIPLAAERWQALPADGVALMLANGERPNALRLTWDFQGRSGWAAAQTKVDATLPPNYEIRFDLRGEGPPNSLEVKLLDGDGNVSWHVFRALAWPRDARAERIRKRQISFAWGPRGGGEISRLAAIEFAVTAGRGGKGWIEISNLRLVEREVPPAVPPAISARASSAAPGHPAESAVDGDVSTAWRPAARAGGAASEELVLDLGTSREFGGISLRWADDLPGDRMPARVSLALSDDGETWAPARTIERAASARSDSDHVRLAETEARFVRISFDGGAGIAEVLLRPLSFGEPNELFATLAREAPRGVYPRSFRGEQEYWTVVGASNDAFEALLSEDGALEIRDGGPAVEPFVALDSALLGWAEARSIEQTLADSELPLPRVLRVHSDLTLAIEPVATRIDGRSLLFVRYRVTNTAARRLRGHLLLAVRPFQVDPPQQFLNRPGGVAPLAAVACRPRGVDLAATLALRASSRPGGCAAASFDDTHALATLPTARPPRAEVDDATAFAAANLAWPFDLAPGAAFELVVGSPLASWPVSEPESQPESQPRPDPAARLAIERALERQLAEGARGFDRLLARERRRWRRALGPLRLDLPPAAAELAHTLRASLAYVLVHRDGAAIQPGSRAYARSWIRDGALSGVALLRLGRGDVAREFAEWFATFQYPDGKVPCCVDARGADPVPEHDSHGQLVHLVVEVFRYTRDRAFAERLWPAVARAVDAIERLRQSRRTAAEASGERAAFWGLLPESISHEGYSAHPVHSYWDDVWAYRGLDDAVELATALGESSAAAEWSARRDEFLDDLLASIERVRATRGLDFLPGSADLGDFDSTATTVTLDPGGLLHRLPRAAVEATFERFAREVEARWRGARTGDAYTPYEIRHIGAFVRLGQRERAHALLDRYLADRRPRGWRQWPEVVTLDPRAARFVGDLPHGWVATDFVRSALDLFAFEDRERLALVVAAGLDPLWLERPRGVAIHHLATPWGELGYRLVVEGGDVRFRFDRGLAVPPGGIVVHWPLTAAGGVAIVDGRLVEPRADGALHLEHLPRTIRWRARQPARAPYRPRPEGTLRRRR